MRPRSVAPSLKAFIWLGRLTPPCQVARDDSNLSKGYGFVSFSAFEASDDAIANMHGQFLMNKEITVQYAYKKDGKGERHGDAAERSLAASGRAHNIEPTIQPLPPQLFNPTAPPSGPSPMPMGMNMGMNMHMSNGDGRGPPPPSPYGMNMGAPPAGFHSVPPPHQQRQPLAPPPMAAGLPARPPPSTAGYGGPPQGFAPAGYGGAPPPGAPPNGFGAPPPPGFGPPGMQPNNGYGAPPPGMAGNGYQRR